MNVGNREFVRRVESSKISPLETIDIILLTERFVNKNITIHISLTPQTYNHVHFTECLVKIIHAILKYVTF